MVKRDLLGGHKVFSLVILLLVCLSVSHAYSIESNSRAKSLVQHGGYALARNGHVLDAYHEELPLVPASIIKLATAVAALEILGPSYRFETRFYNDNATLYIKGFGDPYLISEEVKQIVKKLKENGLRKIHRIVVDQSAFDLQNPAPGSTETDNPYDARNSALAVNFNTVNFRVDEGGNVDSAEMQTPTLPIMRRLSKGLSKGIYRRNIITSSDEIGWKYVGQLFQSFISNSSDSIVVEKGRVPATLSPFYIAHSRTLDEMITPLMQYSNNFIANQIFLICGVQKYGFPATWEKAKKAVADFFNKTYNFNMGSLKVFEGAGLSRYNQVTAKAMVVVLEAFKPYALKLQYKNGAYLKSGTLTGVYSYAGYFPAKDGLDSVVLILNQQKNNRQPLLKELQRISQSTEMR